MCGGNECRQPLGMFDVHEEGLARKTDFFVVYTAVESGRDKVKHDFSGRQILRPIGKMCQPQSRTDHTRKEPD